MEERGGVVVVAIHHQTVADIDLAVSVGLLVAVVWSQNRSSVLGDTEGRSVGNSFPDGLHQTLDVSIDHWSPGLVARVSQADRGRVIVEHALSLRVSKAVVNFLSNCIGVSNTTVDGWVEWINVLG